MAYNAPSSRSTGDLINATIWNADIVANIVAIYAGGLSVTSQAVGDILYASSTTQFARVAAVASGQVLASAGTGTVPAYSATPALTSVDMGGTTVYGSRAITVDTGGVLNVVLASAAGDDFTVDTDKLVVSGDSGNVGINDSSPTYKLDVNGTLRATGATTLDSTLVATGYVGMGTASPLSALHVTGAVAAAGTHMKGVQLSPTVTGATGGWEVYGVHVAPTIVESADGSNPHGNIIGMLVAPTITNGTAATTAATGVQVSAFAAATGTTTATGLRVYAPTSATNNVGIYTNGRVGFGTTTPGYTLDVQHAGDARLLNIAATTGANYAYAAVENTTGLLYWGLEGSSGAEVITGALAYSSFVSTNSATALHLGTAGTARMTLAAGGSVGIGTTAPGYPLAVKGGTNNTGGTSYRGVIATFQTESYDQWLSITGDGSGAAGGMGIEYGRGTGVPELFVMSGRIGIGTTSPAAGLSVEGGAIFNESGADANFRIEGDDDANVFAVNASGDNIGIGHMPTDDGAAKVAIECTGKTGMTIDQGTPGEMCLRLEGGGTGTVKAFAVRNSSGTEKFTVTDSGTLAKTSGTFCIDHPLSSMAETHQLVHSFIEGPQADLIYRGTVTLVDGTATVDLDDVAGMTTGTWGVLCRDEQCFTSNETGWYHVRGTVTGSTLTIDCEEANCTDTVSWMVVANRKDTDIIEAGWTDEDGYPILEPLKPTE